MSRLESKLMNEQQSLVEIVKLKHAQFDKLLQSLLVQTSRESEHEPVDSPKTNLGLPQFLVSHINKEKVPKLQIKP